MSTSDYINKGSYAQDLGFFLKLASEPIELDLEGTLKRTPSGFVYIELPNAIRTSFLGLIKSIDPKAHVPIPESKDKDIGCHISVINKKELGPEKSDLDELGKSYKFKINGLDIIEDPDGWPEIKTCYTIRCSSPELEKLRTSLDLPKLYKDHRLHITLAVVDR